MTRNNATTLAFRNGQAGTGRHMFGVKLRGAAGNPQTLGARIRVELTDGLIETSEVAGAAE